MTLHPDPIAAFPPGTTVKIYKRPAGAPRSWVPVGAALSEPTVSAAGALKVEALEEGAIYVATAVVGGVTKKVQFTVVPTASSSGLSKAEVEALIAEHGAGEPNWEAVAFGEGVASFDGEYSPFKAACTSEGVVLLSGLLKLTGTKAPGAVLFTLPASCHPTSTKVLKVGNAEAAGEFAVKVKANGVVEVLTEMSGAVIPIFDAVSFTKNH